jgi:hypothetical protein
MRRDTILSFGLLSLGLILLGLGFSASRAPVEQVTEALTGSFSDGTMWYLLGGGLALIAGLALAFTSRRD